MTKGFMEHFRCCGEPERQIATELCQRAGVEACDVYCHSEAMAAMAQTICQVEGDVLCKLPFATMAEAEQLGAKWGFSSNMAQPVPGALPYEKLSEVEIPAFSFDYGLMQENLQAIRLLKSKGERISFNIEGPFTLLSLLVPSKEIYKGMRAQPELLRSLCERLIDNIELEAIYVAEAGVDVISYADPLISCNMVSPTIYTTLCGDIIREALQRITAAVPGVTVHVCSATSAAFQRAGFCHCRSYMVPKGMCYGEALCFIRRQAGVRLVGHGCLQHSCCKMVKPVVYELELC
ncbi:MAG: hypothetical protein II778_01130 [Anaerovibrio sp.]|nr:hypothetical protein [Anaerovibrio sp.]